MVFGSKTSNRAEIKKKFHSKFGFEQFMEIKNLNFSFGSKKILKNINLIIKKNNIIGIVGKSGSGKSTLANLIVGILKPENGKIIFGSNSWKTRGMSSPEYLKNESNLRVLRNGIPIGKIPFFLLFTNKGEVARPPEYVELSKRRELGDAENVEGRYSFYVDDWAEGLLDIRNC